MAERAANSIDTMILEAALAALELRAAQIDPNLPEDERRRLLVQAFGPLLILHEHGFVPPANR